MKRPIWVVSLSVMLALIPQLSYGRTLTESRIWVMKTDSLGDSLWVRFYEGELPFVFGQDFVQQTSDGGLIISGSHISGDLVRSLYLLKLDSNYDSVWARVYNREDGGIGYYMKKFIELNGKPDSASMPLTKNLSGQAVVEAPDKGYLILGQLFTDSVPYAPDVINVTHEGIQIIKTDSLGNLIWKQTYKGEGQSIYLKLTSDGGCIVTQETNLTGESRSVWLLKLDSLGDTMWTRAYDGYVSIPPKETPEGGFIIAGERDSKSLLMKTDSRGNLLWDHLYEKRKYGQWTSFSITRDSGYIVSSLVEDTLYLIKMNGDGEVVWEHPYGRWNICFWIHQTSDNGYIVAGMKTGATRESWLVKTDSLGSLLWQRTYPLGANSFGSWVIQTTDDDYIVVGGANLGKKK